MTQIKEIGHFCSTDRNGYISNDSSIEKIDEEFLEVIKEVKRSYIQHVGPHIHSLYIRGSIPRGLGIKGVSDLDTIAVTNKRVEELDLSWAGRVEQGINKLFDCVNGVELSFYYIEDLLEDTTRFSIIPFMLKTHSVCIHGENIQHQLPHYKADRTLTNEHLVNVKGQIERAKSDLIDNTDQEDIADCCSWIMKIMVRAGLTLTIEKENLYTRDLYPAYKLFREHFPEKEQDMRKALMFVIDPARDADILLTYLTEFGTWMIDEAERWLHIYNPNRDLNMKL